MRLSHNLASLNIYEQYSKVLKNQSTSLQRISSGKKLMAAKDNPNEIAESEKLQMQIRGLQMSQRNLQDGASMLQTADGAMDEITSMLQRIKELTVQANDPSNGPSNKQIVQNEIQKMAEGIDCIANGTTFNGSKLLNVASGDPLSLTYGTSAGETIDIPRFNLTSTALGNGSNFLSDIDVTTSSGADNAIDIVDSALDTVIQARSKYGALENRFESGMVNVTAISDRLSSADSSISDVDIADEIIEYTKDNVLAEAGNAMLAQSNKFPQQILSILQNIK